MINALMKGVNHVPGFYLGARASRPHTVPLAAAELQCDAAGSHPAGGNRIGQAEGKPWRRSRLIQVGEMAEAVPGLVRAGRPRSRERELGTLLNYWNNLDRRFLNSGYSTTSPAHCASYSSNSTTSPVHAQGHQIADAFGCRLSFKQVHLSSALFVSIRVHSWFVFMSAQPFSLE